MSIEIKKYVPELLKHPEDQKSNDASFTEIVKAMRGKDYIRKRIMNQIEPQEGVRYCIK